MSEQHAALHIDMYSDVTSALATSAMAFVALIAARETINGSPRSIRKSSTEPLKP